MLKLKRAVKMIFKGLLVPSRYHNNVFDTGLSKYWMMGLSMMGSISFGWLFVAGNKRVPDPATAMTAFVISIRR